MFYCSEILNQQRGQFAIIWLAATRGRKLTRRDFNSVNIVRTCESIITYLFATSSRKRLSLYLSTQLMFGTLLIYRKQQDLLLDDLSTLMTRFHKSYTKQVEINMKMITKKEQVTKTNVMDEMEPGFGELFQMEIPSVHEIPDIDVWKSDFNLEIARLSPVSSRVPIKELTSLLASPPLEDSTKRKRARSPHTVSGADISIKEVSIEKPAVPEEQPELPALGYQDLIMIAEQVTEVEVPAMPTVPQDAPQQTSGLETPKHASPKEVIPDAPDRQKKHEAVDLNVTREIDEPVPKRKRPIIPPMILSPVVSVSGKPRKRRLLVDMEIIINRDTLRKQLSHTEDLVRDIAEVKVPHDLQFQSSMKELFKYPAKKEFKQKSLFPLWKRNLVQVKDFSETESEKKRPIFSVPELQLSSTSESSASSVKSEERPRKRPKRFTDDSLSTETVRRAESIASDRAMTPVSVSFGKSVDSLHGSVSLEDSMLKSLGEEEMMKMPEDLLTQRLEEELYPLPEEVPLDLSKVTLSPVKHIPETVPTSEFSLLNLVQSVEKHTLDQNWTTFKEICPLYMPRSRAAVIFSTLLVALRENCVIVKQDEPYGEILIRLR